MSYVPKSKREEALAVKERLKKWASKVKEEDDALHMMINLIERSSEEVDKAVSAALFAAKATIIDRNAQRVFIQDFAAALNRRGLLSNTNVQPFREYGYQYMWEA